MSSSSVQRVSEDLNTLVLRTFTCPITTEIMVDPVICPDGHSFERVAIEAWLQSHSTNPVTRKPLTVAQLSPNRALKESIGLFLKRTNGKAAAEAKIQAAMRGGQETAAAAAGAFSFFSDMAAVLVVVELMTTFRIN